MPNWDADLYLRFESQRTQPSIDLASRIQIEAPRRVIDLGCGPGNSTAVLRKRWPKADLVGLDHSENMLATARQTMPNVQWLEGDIARWTASSRYDVVFSNAALQWIPDHKAVIKNLAAQISPGGALAVQIPAHYDSPLHRVMVEVSQQERWRDELAPAVKALTIEPTEFYYNVVSPLTRAVDVWLTVYYHVMESHQTVVDWIHGTGMRPYLEALGDETRRGEFVRMVLSGYEREFPRQADGNILLPFQRLFFVGYF